MALTCRTCLAPVLLKDDKYKDNGVTLMHDPMQPQNNNLMPQGDSDHEGAMAKADLYKLANYSVKLFKKINDEDQLDSWVQAKITKAADYIASVYHYLEYEMKFSEFGSKLENSEIYTESEKKELKNKLMEAKEKVKELKKLQAEKLSGKKTVKVKESWDDDDEDPDVAKAEKELKKQKVKLPKVKVDPDKDMSKLAKKTKKEDDLDEARDEDLEELSKDTLKSYVDKRQWDTGANEKMQKKMDTGLSRAEKKIKQKNSKPKHSDDDLDETYGQGVYESWDDDDEDPDVKRADSELKKRGVKLPKTKADPDKDMSKLAKKSKKDDDDLDESSKTVKEAVKKAKKDYDGDGKIESDKDEVWGSRMKAAKKAGKLKESISEGIDNFTAADIKELEGMRDPDMMRSRAAELIQTPSKKPIKPEKIAYYLKQLDRMDKPIEIISLMYNMLLGGEGHGVIGSKHSMGKSHYQQRFGETGVEEMSDEENDVISAPQPAPEPNPEENDVISAPMNEGADLARMKELLTRLNG